MALGLEEAEGEIEVVSGECFMVRKDVEVGEGSMDPLLSCQLCGI